MKPRIRKGQGSPFLRTWWLCLTPGTWYKGGIGKTPREAYEDWERQHGFDSDA